MRPRKSFPPDTAKRLEKLLASSCSVAERSRIECVYLRAKYGYSAEEIAKETGFGVQTVRNIHSIPFLSPAPKNRKFKTTPMQRPLGLSGLTHNTL
jgi:hypothetical protein